tara:strand:- start:1437 stop:2945 length:1509 start_codon:yes stop_codon:yes gene_type:complete
MNKGFAFNNYAVSGPLFDDDSVARELELVAGETKSMNWESPTGELFSLHLPHTVYPPREDTSFLAKNLLKLGPGKRRRCLEIGIGSGVLSLFCHRQGWEVSACDVNPLAVACAKQFLESNHAAGVKVREGGIGPKNDGKLEQWSPNDNYELIFWNMPYMRVDSNEQAHLGPFEEAALIDTSNTSLISLTLLNIKNLSLLKKTGLVMLTVGEQYDENELINLCAKYGFAGRVVDKLIFGDGEQLRILAVWHPFSRYPLVHKDVVRSTNLELLHNDWPVGSSLAAQHQTDGYGRYNRLWANAAQLVACSWKIKLPEKLTPATTQIVLGFLVKQSFESVQRTPKTNIVLKWPNDLIVLTPEKSGKVSGVLLESVSNGENTTTVAGIGINISEGEKPAQHDFFIGYADWFSDQLTPSYMKAQLHCRMASVFESRVDLPSMNFGSIKKSAFRAIKDGFMASNNLKYRNRTMTFRRLNDDGTISLADSDEKEVIIDEGESLQWSFERL